MSKLIIEFPNDKIRDRFLGQLSDGGIEDVINTCFEAEDIRISFDYRKAFKEWGWNGEGDPTVIMRERE